MAKKFSTSKLKSQIRKAERESRRAVSNYNKAAKDYNRQVNKVNAAIKDFNRESRKAVREYNSAVRKYNAQVREYQRIINKETQRLKTSSRIIVSTQYDNSSLIMHNCYSDIEKQYPEGVSITDAQNLVLDLIEQEQANNLITTNNVFGGLPIESNTEDIEIRDSLSAISDDLSNRWKGAIYSLSPQNPDATRHFCTSARELITELIEMNAPDDSVFKFKPSAVKTDRGNATRREKINYMMRNMELNESVSIFIDADIENILSLFHVLSDGTHGKAGKYSYNELMQVKKRVESGIYFLTKVIGIGDSQNERL